MKQLGKAFYFWGLLSILLFGLVISCDLQQIQTVNQPIVNEPLDWPTSDNWPDIEDPVIDEPDIEDPVIDEPDIEDLIPIPQTTLTTHSRPSCQTGQCHGSHGHGQRCNDCHR